MKPNQNEHSMFKRINVLSPQQKKDFYTYLPKKVYKTESNISLLVGFSQLCMILLFLFTREISSAYPRTVAYFVLYFFLLTVTAVSFVLYRYTVRAKKLKMFLWVRRISAVLLCVWVLGITCIEQIRGNGITVYCYLLPTMAAVLLFSPLESSIIFGSTWIGFSIILHTVGASQGSIFGDMVNGIFVSLLALYISFRYYGSTAVEFCDRQTIEGQYEEIKTKNQLLQQLANVDQLTGLYNRHYLHEAVYPLFEASKQKSEYAMCLMVDIDFFKQYNDFYGHLQGDACLRTMAAAVQRFCKANDAVAIRYGGEEFLIVKIAQIGFDALQLAQQLQAQIAAANLPRADVAQQHVTVSIGLWYSPLQRAKGISAAIENADDALYRAKANGRNCICAWEGVQEHEEALDL